MLSQMSVTAFPIIGVNAAGKSTLLSEIRTTLTSVVFYMFIRTTFNIQQFKDKEKISRAKLYVRLHIKKR